MARRARAWARIAAAALVASLGCASDPPSALRWQQVDGADDAARIVVAPLNLSLRLDHDLEDAVAPVEEEIIRTLQSSGARVALIWPPADAWSLWRDSMAAIQSSEDPDRDLEAAAGVFVRTLREHADFDLVVMPSLVFREARVVGRTARWDGVQRRVSVRVRPGPESGAPATEWEGRITGLSLYVLGFTPEGRRLFEGLGGLDLVHDAVVAETRNHGRSFLRLQREVLENPEHVQEGVALALDGYRVARSQ
jgi:hypothetical protein